MDEIEYLEEYEDLILPTMSSHSVATKSRATSNLVSMADDEDSSSIDQDIFESLFDDHSDDESVMQKKVPAKLSHRSERSSRISMDSLDMLVKDLGEPLNPLVDTTKQVKSMQKPGNTRFTQPSKGVQKASATTSVSVRGRSTPTPASSDSNKMSNKPQSAAATTTAAERNSKTKSIATNDIPSNRAPLNNSAGSIQNAKVTSASLNSSKAGMSTASTSRKQISAATSTTGSSSGTLSRRNDNAPITAPPKRIIERSQTTIIKPEKPQIKDPAEDPLSLENIENESDSDTDSFVYSDISADTFVSLSDVDDDDRQVIELSNDSNYDRVNLDKIRGSTPSPTVSDDYKSDNEDSKTTPKRKESSVLERNSKAANKLRIQQYVDNEVSTSGHPKQDTPRSSKEKSKNMDKSPNLSDTLLDRIDTVLSDVVDSKVERLAVKKQIDDVELEVEVETNSQDDPEDRKAEVTGSAMECNSDMDGIKNTGPEAIQEPSTSISLDMEVEVVEQKDELGVEGKEKVDEVANSATISHKAINTPVQATNEVVEILDITDESVAEKSVSESIDISQSPDSESLTEEASGHLIGSQGNAELSESLEIEQDERILLEYKNLKNVDNNRHPKDTKEGNDSEENNASKSSTPYKENVARKNVGPETKKTCENNKELDDKNTKLEEKLQQVEKSNENPEKKEKIKVEIKPNNGNGNNNKRTGNVVENKAKERGKSDMNVENKSIVELKGGKDIKSAEKSTKETKKDEQEKISTQINENQFEPVKKEKKDEQKSSSTNFNATENEKAVKLETTINTRKRDKQTEMETPCHTPMQAKPTEKEAQTNEKKQMDKESKNNVKKDEPNVTSDVKKIDQAAKRASEVQPKAKNAKTDIPVAKIEQSSKESTNEVDSSQYSRHSNKQKIEAKKDHKDVNKSTTTLDKSISEAQRKSRPEIKADKNITSLRPEKKNERNERSQMPQARKMPMLTAEKTNVVEKSQTGGRELNEPLGKSKSETPISTTKEDEIEENNSKEDISLDENRLENSQMEERKVNDSATPIPDKRIRGLVVSLKKTDLSKVLNEKLVQNKEKSVDIVSRDSNDEKSVERLSRDSKGEKSAERSKGESKDEKTASKATADSKGESSVDREKESKDGKSGNNARGKRDSNDEKSRSGGKTDSKDDKSGSSGKRDSKDDKFLDKEKMDWKDGKLSYRGKTDSKDERSTVRAKTDMKDDKSMDKKKRDSKRDKSSDRSRRDIKDEKFADRTRRDYRDERSTDRAKRDYRDERSTDRANRDLRYEKSAYKDRRDSRNAKYWDRAKRDEKSTDRGKRDLKNERFMDRAKRDLRDEKSADKDRRELRNEKSLDRAKSDLKYEKSDAKANRESKEEKSAGEAKRNLKDEKSSEKAKKESKEVKSVDREKANLKDGKSVDKIKKGTKYEKSVEQTKSKQSENVDKKIDKESRNTSAVDENIQHIENDNIKKLQTQKLTTKQELVDRKKEELKTENSGEAVTGTSSSKASGNRAEIEKKKNAEICEDKSADYTVEQKGQQTKGVCEITEDKKQIDDVEDNDIEIVSATSVKVEHKDTPKKQTRKDMASSKITEIKTIIESTTKMQDKSAKPDTVDENKHKAQVENAAPKSLAESTDQFNRNKGEAESTNKSEDTKIAAESTCRRKTRKTDVETADNRKVKLADSKNISETVNKTEYKIGETPVESLYKMQNKKVEPKTAGEQSDKTENKAAVESADKMRDKKSKVETLESTDKEEKGTPKSMVESSDNTQEKKSKAETVGESSDRTREKNTEETYKTTNTKTVAENSDETREQKSKAEIVMTCTDKTNEETVTPKAAAESSDKSHEKKENTKIAVKNSDKTHEKKAKAEIAVESSDKTEKKTKPETIIKSTNSTKEENVTVLAIAEGSDKTLEEIMRKKETKAEIVKITDKSKEEKAVTKAEKADKMSDKNAKAESIEEITDEIESDNTKGNETAESSHESLNKKAELVSESVETILENKSETETVSSSAEKKVDHKTAYADKNPNEAVDKAVKCIDKTLEGNVEAERADMSSDKKSEAENVEGDSVAGKTTEMSEMKVSGSESRDKTETETSVTEVSENETIARELHKDIIELKDEAQNAEKTESNAGHTSNKIKRTRITQQMSTTKEKTECEKEMEAASSEVPRIHQTRHARARAEAEIQSPSSSPATPRPQSISEEEHEGSIRRSLRKRAADNSPSNINELMKKGLRGHASQTPTAGLTKVAQKLNSNRSLTVTPTTVATRKRARELAPNTSVDANDNSPGKRYKWESSRKSSRRLHNDDVDTSEGEFDSSIPQRRFRLAGLKEGQVYKAVHESSLILERKTTQPTKQNTGTELRGTQKSLTTPSSKTSKDKPANAGSNIPKECQVYKAVHESSLSLERKTTQPAKQNSGTEIRGAQKSLTTPSSKTSKDKPANAGSNISKVAATEAKRNQDQEKIQTTAAEANKKRTKSELENMQPPKKIARSNEEVTQPKSPANTQKTPTKQPASTTTTAAAQRTEIQSDNGNTPSAQEGADPLQIPVKRLRRLQAIDGYDAINVSEELRTEEWDKRNVATTRKSVRAGGPTDAAKGAETNKTQVKQHTQSQQQQEQKVSESSESIVETLKNKEAGIESKKQTEKVELNEPDQSAASANKNSTSKANIEPKLQASPTKSPGSTVITFKEWLEQQKKSSSDDGDDVQLESGESVAHAKETTDTIVICEEPERVKPPEVVLRCKKELLQLINMSKRSEITSSKERGGAQETTKQTPNASKQSRNERTMPTAGNNTTQFKRPSLPQRSIRVTPSRTSNRTPTPGDSRMSLGNTQQIGRQAILHKVDTKLKLRKLRVRINRSTVTAYFKNLNINVGKLEEHGIHSKMLSPSRSAGDTSLLIETGEQGQRNSFPTISRKRIALKTPTPLPQLPTLTARPTLTATAVAASVAEDSTRMPRLTKVPNSLEESSTQTQNEADISPNAAAGYQHGSNEELSLLTPMKSVSVTPTSTTSSSRSQQQQQKQLATSTAANVRDKRVSATSSSDSSTTQRSHATGVKANASGITKGPQVPFMPVVPKEEIIDDQQQQAQQPVSHSATAASLDNSATTNSLASRTLAIAAATNSALNQTPSSDPSGYYGLTPITLDSNGTRLYSFLHPAKYSRNHGCVLLDYCCPNLDGPMPAIDPTRIHAQVQAGVRELPAYIVMTTKLITRADLEANKNVIPASIRQKVEKITADASATASAVSGTPNVSMSMSPAPQITPTPQNTPASKTSLTPTITALQKHLPPTTSITPKLAPPVTATTTLTSTPQNTLNSSSQSGAATASTSQMITVSDYQRSLLRTSVRQFDARLKKYYYRVAMLSFSDRQSIIDNIINSTTLTPKDIECAVRLLDEYASQISLISGSPVVNTPKPVTTAIQSVSKVITTPTTNTVVRTTTIQQQLQKQNQQSSKGQVAVLDKDNSLLGYQLTTSATTLSKSTISTRSSIMSSTTAGVKNTSLPNMMATTSAGLPSLKAAQDSPRIFYTKPPMQTSTPIETTTSSGTTPLSGGKTVSLRSTSLTIRQIPSKLGSVSSTTVAATPPTTRRLPALTRNPHLSTRTTTPTSSLANTSSTSDLITTRSAPKRMTRASAAAKVIVITQNREADNTPLDECILPDGHNNTEIKSERLDDDFVGGN
ncbi:serine-rich adhesin for platelets isoform X2 [Anastrepha ludens]|uniref:serine-rich adhesin for platelets isoform X2 n=1 Tax=Anastrepha ludens TaxID=28586 RepID=UPI0023AF3D9F|nr:serine-rich adhesin for platelets isoform X2 [Anastrepha ludens]